MLKRYSLERMENVWSEANKFRLWLVVEIAVLKARKKMGQLHHEIKDKLIDEIVIDPDEINRIEKEITKHDVIAFLMHISPQFPEELQSWLHRGLTSYDIGDTALSLQLRESIEILLSDIMKLMNTVRDVAKKYKYCPQIGRTHGIHAEPITFGVKMANWYEELKRHRERLRNLQDLVSVGKISGAVGMYTVDPEIEEEVCKELGLRPIVATQIISRDVIADYMSTLGGVCASIGKIATNIRLLSQTEIGELMEPFGRDQKGSSAMPHKKNPIGSENIAGLMRVAYSYVNVAYENLSSCWHERSLDNSGSERIILADTSTLLDFAIERLGRIIKEMRVFPEKMINNLNLTKGLVFSQEVMMLVAEKSGLPREQAHTLVRNVALDCWETGNDFLATLISNSEIMSYVSTEELESCFDIDSKLRNVDYIFFKVFSENYD